jgi:hypothetical protein
MEKLGPDQIKFTETRRDNSMRSGITSRYLPLHLEGEVREFYPNGNLKSISEYSNNQLVSNRNWLSDGTKYVDTVFYSADIEPLFNPGPEFFQSYLLQQLKNSKVDLNQIDDEVVIGWVVMETGQTEGVMALQGRSRQFNKLLVEIIAGMPGIWEPARLDGRPVRYFMSIPLNFTHDEYLFQEVEFSSGMLHYNQY